MVINFIAKMLSKFDCIAEHEMKEYVKCKKVNNQGEKLLKMMQPLLIKSFENDFEIPGCCCSVTPAVPGSILMKHNPRKKLNISWAYVSYYI